MSMMPGIHRNSPTFVAKCSEFVHICGDDGGNAGSNAEFIAEFGADVFGVCIAVFVGDCGVDVLVAAEAGVVGFKGDGGDECVLCRGIAVAEIG